MLFNLSLIVGGNMANGILNCYLFEKSVEEVVTFRISQFTDFTDVYTSFLFNLLSQSL